MRMNGDFVTDGDALLLNIDGASIPNSAHGFNRRAV